MPLTHPGPTDCHWIAITMSPEATTVEFCEDRADATEAATINLMPTVSTYVGELALQGEHRVRGSSKHIAVHVAVTPTVRAALRARFPTARRREDLQAALSALLQEAIEHLGEPLAFDTEITSVMRGREHAIPEAIAIEEDSHGAR